MHFFQLRLLVPMHAPFIDMFISIQLFTRYKKPNNSIDLPHLLN